MRAVDLADESEVQRVERFPALVVSESRSRAPHGDAPPPPQDCVNYRRESTVRAILYSRTRSVNRMRYPPPIPFGVSFFPNGASPATEIRPIRFTLGQGT